MTATALEKPHPLAGKRIYFIGNPAVSEGPYDFLGKQDVGYELRRYERWGDSAAPLSREHVTAALEEITALAAEGKKPDAVIIYKPDIQYTSGSETINPVLADLLVGLKKAGIKSMVADNVGAGCAIARRLLGYAGADQFVDNPKPPSRIFGALVGLFEERQKQF